MNNLAFIPKIKLSSKILIFCLLYCYIITTYGEAQELQFGRYLTFTISSVTHTPLDTIIQKTRFPTSIKTIGETARYLLKGTGVQLARTHISPNNQQLYNYTLPNYLRSIEPTTLREALLALVGNSYQIVYDPVHRLVTFKLREDYKNF